MCNQYYIRNTCRKQCELWIVIGYLLLILDLINYNLCQYINILHLTGLFHKNYQLFIGDIH